MKKVLAIDMGATSIRGITGYISEGKLITEEVMRLSHEVVRQDGRIRWQWDKLIGKIALTLKEHSKEISSVGIDTWGVDFGFIDAQGELLETPVSYRDAEHEIGYREAIEHMPAVEIFKHTGNQLMSINTLFQLIACMKLHPEKYKRADKILLLPDLIQYIMTGNTVGEETIWSTSQILNLKTGELDRVLLKSLDISDSLFPTKVLPGSITGNTGTSRLEILKGSNIDVIAVCGHDTASAVLLTEAYSDSESMFLSCGTWSLFGVAAEEVELSTRTFEAELTNELGYNSKPLLFKNITGLYLLEKFKAQLESELSKKLEFAEITEYVETSLKNNKAPGCMIDMDDKRFAADDMNAREAIDSYLRERDMPVPESGMDYFRIIYESLVDKYKSTRDDIERITGRNYDRLHIIGGGARSELLCRLISDRLKIEVKAGPYEASALGNIIVQLKAIGEIENIESGIKAALSSQIIKNYSPEN